MPKIAISLVAAVALAAAGVAIAHAASSAAGGSTYTYRAALTPGAETPKPKGAAGAKGTFTASVSGTGKVRTFKWRLTFSGLSGTAAAAHVHRGKAGSAGAVLVPLCGPCRSGQTGTLRIRSDAGDALERGQTYVNVHTAKNMGGEIRGQVKLTGETSGQTSGGGTTTVVTDTTVPGY